MSAACDPDVLTFFESHLFTSTGYITSQKGLGQNKKLYKVGVHYLVEPGTVLEEEDLKDYCPSPDRDDWEPPAKVSNPDIICFM